MDKYIFTGNVGNTPEVRKTQNGKDMVTFSVAIDKSYKDATGAKVPKTKWISCTRFIDQGKPWGVLPYLKKGTKVLIEGEPEARAWINATSGEAAGALNVIVQHLDLMGSAPTDAEPQPQAQTQTQQARPQAQQPTAYAQTEPDVPTDDLPF